MTVNDIKKEVERSVEWVSESSRMLSRIADAIDEEEGDISEKAVAIFNEKALTQKEGIDQFAFAYDALQKKIEELKSIKKALDDKIKAFEKAKEAVGSRMVEIISTNDGIPFEGACAKVSAQNNSQAKLTINLIDDRGFSPVTTKHISDVVDDNFLFMRDIPERYIETVKISKLNTKAIREDLEAGINIPWAVLERGKHLRVRV